ncbi:MAG: MCP four helix bundle domain-containing protein [Pirellulaceae bacterium]|nr:MCP four helix bundle domain-containing protein [Pirellulaceae bacterium]
MRSKLATKISVAIVGVVALALSCSVVALLSTRHIGGLMQDAVKENLSSLRAAEELDNALLRKRGLVVSFMLDSGNPQRLEDLQRTKQSFYDALDLARKTAHTAGEKALLDELEQAYQKYDEKRTEMIAIYQSGENEKAVAVFLNEVSSLSDHIDRLTGEFIAENKRYIESATTRAQHRIGHINWLVGGFACLTFGLGLLLAWLFFHGVFFPLRKMVADARNFTGQRSLRAAEMPTDELPAVGEYLRSLMCDVSDARSALGENRRRLMNAEKLATVGKLAAGVAHEIRNPLTAVKMWLFSIRKAVGHDPELDRKFEIISEEMTRLERIVCNFLEFSRPSALKLEAQSVSLLIDKTLELFGHRIEERKLRLVRNDAEPILPVMADGEQLKQVFINVLDNAVEATAERGEIRIVIDTADETDDRSMVVVRVQDTGQGMPQDVRDRIFEPFYTTKDDGTGLGLCIAAHIMARHGGRLVLESSTERGTTFAVWIPIARKEAHEQNPGS